ncbi:MAG: hypothetical protein KGZ66_11605 [Selenomonadales bacterium]|nr:hypothetical protein [Selenomonadales bacterium]
MPKALPTGVAAQLKRAVFKKADLHGYALKGRVENGRFMDDLVNDPEIGGIIGEYVAADKVRVYIKDGILNAYTKRKAEQVLRGHDPVQVIRSTFGAGEVAIVENKGEIVVGRSSDGRFFIVGRGTVLKWESALRKVLEYIARLKRNHVDENYPSICLQLAVINYGITEGDKNQITRALMAVGVKVYFCSS